MVATTDVVVAIHYLVAMATTTAVNGLFGLSLFPAYVATAMVVAIAVVAAASSYQKVGGVTTAHSISYWNTSISFTYI